MVELKGRQPWETEGELHCRSLLTLTAQGLVPCWNQMHIHIVESLQLEDSYGGDLLYLIYLPVVVDCQSITVIWLDRKWKVEIKEKISMKIDNQWLLKWKLLSHVRLFATPGTIQSHGILQARILEWVAFPFFRGSSQHRDWTQVSCIAGRFLTSWVTIFSLWASWWPKWKRKHHKYRNPCCSGGGHTLGPQRKKGFSWHFYLEKISLQSCV